MKESEELLNTLKSIDGTLKRIEQTLQHEELKKVISHALLGEKHKTTPKDE